MWDWLRWCEGHMHGFWSVIDIDLAEEVDYSPAPMGCCWRALALGFVLSCFAAAADQFSFEPREGVLVLRNGFVLHGRITPLGESYLVSFGERGEARLPRTEVEFECRNLEEAYLLKRDALEADDAKAHLQLADWCLRHRLLARAADQLLIASNQDPSHPALASLSRRLETLATLASAPTPTPPPSPNATLASHSSPIPPPLVRDVPPFLVQQFTVSIQPILFNRCATHACHGTNSSTSYRLLRPSLGQVATSRLTHRNLQATLAFIDRNQPQTSRLIAMAQQPHGGVVETFFPDKTANQLELLATWVRRLGMEFPESQASKALASSKPTVRPTGPAIRNNTPSGLRAPTRGPENGVRPADHVESIEAGANSKPAAQGDTYLPRDPFDPEVFNRRFHQSK